MPQFSYSAVDASGRTVQGVLDAMTENDLIVRLSGQGLRIQSFKKGGVAPSPNPPVVARPISPPIVQNQPAPRPQQVFAPLRAAQIEMPAAMQMTQATPRAPVAVQRTKRVKYRDLMFLFSQLSNLMRSGINPATALNDLARRQTRPFLAQALQNMAQMTTEGRGMADAMEVYPDIFPPGAVGAVRASEAGGYVWEALQMLSDQNNQAHKLAWAVRLFRWVALIALFAIPITVIIVQALDYSFGHSVDAMTGFTEYVKGFGVSMVGPVGLVILLMFITYHVAAWKMRRTESRAKRHQLGSGVPIFSRRSRAESLAAFNWHLRKLSEAGLPPGTAWNLAAAALPNEEYSKRLGEVGRQAVDRNRLSELVRRSGIYPQEYIGLVETGEMAGNLPGALDQASRLAAEDMNHAEKASRMGLYGAYLLLFMVVGVFCGVTFYAGYFNSVYKHTVGETEQNP